MFRTEEIKLAAHFVSPNSCVCQGGKFENVKQICCIDIFDGEGKLKRQIAPLEKSMLYDHKKGVLTVVGANFTAEENIYVRVFYPAEK